jgi:hypothetical protein
MDLNDFVRETLIQISDGIAGANEKLRDMDGVVNPLGLVPFWENGVEHHHPVEPPGKETYPKRIVEIVHFDVAVHASDKTSGGGKAGIEVAIFSIGGTAKKEKSGGSESRIQFRIPVVFPSGKKDQLSWDVDPDS